MRIATWNVNSIRSRLERLLEWLDRRQPDVVCLQELKTQTSAFPFEPLKHAGYSAAVHGQKTYNGVAILSRSEPRDIVRSFADGGEDAEARFVSALVDGVTVLSVYVPNGTSVGSDRWEYKLDWMRRLRRYLDTHAEPSDALLLCGDINIAPHDSDVANPDAWRDTVLCHEDGRRALEHVTEWGLVDAFRLKNREGGFYSWWDYRRLGFARNDGLRIDHIFATQSLSEKLVSAEIDRQERKGKKPSDHAPVIAVFSGDI